MKVSLQSTATFILYTLKLSSCWQDGCRAIMMQLIWIRTRSRTRIKTTHQVADDISSGASTSRTHRRMINVAGKEILHLLGKIQLVLLLGLDAHIGGIFEFCVVYWHLVSVGTFNIMHGRTLFSACKSPDQTCPLYLTQGLLCGYVCLCMVTYVWLRVLTLSPLRVYTKYKTSYEVKFQFIADPTSPIPSHCAVIILFKSVQVHHLSWLAL